MPKRKRSTEEAVEEIFNSGSTDIFRALKASKGYERQRLAKRLRDDRATSIKVARLEREVLVLKSLDLQQAAHAHLCSSVLKVKGAAESPDLPDEIKRGVVRPDLSEDERVALHNVTSALFNRPQVRQVLEKAVGGICAAIGVVIPGKKKKGRPEKRGKDDEEEEEEERGSNETKRQSAAVLRKAIKQDDADGDSDDAEFAGFSDSDAEEKALAQMEAMIGASSDEDDDFRAEEEMNDDISLPGSDSVPEDDERDDISLPDSDSAGSASEPETQPPATATASSSSSSKRKNTSSTATTAKTARPIASTFLPGLAGGYIDDSESEASDLDMAPMRKNRRGQKARQAIWEKKYKQNAKHLNKPQDSRSAGWDMKRGAVDESDERRPWKKGVRTPFKKDTEHDGSASAPLQRSERKPVKTKEEEPTHPSWIAARNAKKQQGTAHFQGKKITFD